MELNEFIGIVQNFGGLSDPEKVVHVGWFLHTQRKRDRFDVQDVRSRREDTETAEDTFDADYGRLLDRVCGKRVASPSIPSWNQIEGFLLRMKELQQAGGFAA